MVNNPVLLLLDRGFYHFETQLLPVARKLNELHGIDSVLVTFNPEDFDFDKFHELKDISFITLENKILKNCINSKTVELNEIEKAGSHRTLLKILFVVPKRIKTLWHWRKRAVELLDNVKPSAILLQKINREEVPFLLKIAKRRGIPTVALQTNWGAIYRTSKKDHSWSLDYRKILSKLYRIYIHFIDYIVHALLLTPIELSDPNRIRTKGKVDLFCIEDEWFRQGYIKNGYNPQNIVVTGDPASDSFNTEYKNFSPQKNTDIRKQIHTPVNAKVLLFLLTNGKHFSQTQQNIRLKRLEDVLNYLNQSYPEHYVWLSVHPRDNSIDYEGLSQSFRRLRIINTTIHAVYLSADIVLTEGSRSILYAHWAHKPAAIYSLTKDEAAAHASRVFKTKLYEVPEEIGDWFDQCKHKESNFSYLSWTYCKDGMCSERIVNSLIFSSNKSET